MLLATCNTMRANGIEVFTVGFALTAVGEKLLKSCAGSTSNFIAASNEADLKAAFKRIGRIVGVAMPHLVF